jgi:hypothetical protein
MGSGLFMSPYKAKLQKAMNSGRAFPDMFFYEPRRGYHGMGLEIKKEGTTLIVKRGPRKGHWVNDPHILEQVMFLKELAKRGYYTNIVAGYDEAIKTINWYFGIEQGE